MPQNTPDDRLYSKEHEWLKISGQQAAMGISDHAQKSLGDVVYVELPNKGSNISKGAAIGVVESVKAVSDIYAPVSGKVVEVNQKVIDNPELINQDPYGEGWLLLIEPSEEEVNFGLLAPQEYQKLLADEAK